MVRIEEKTLDDFLGDAQTTLQNSLITTSYKLVYNVGTSNYTLPGFATGNERIYSILSIEGTGFLPEDYLTEDDIGEGVDYNLWDNYSEAEIIDAGYGAVSNSQVYTGVTIIDQTFKNGTTVYIKYQYQNPNYVPILTNFSPNSILKMILTASLLNTQQSNSQLTSLVDSFGLDAEGENLERIGTLVKVERTVANSTIGQLLLANSDIVIYSVTPSHRFAAMSGNSFVTFVPDDAVQIPAEGSAYVNVTALVSGKVSNVGAYAITRGFTNTLLTSSVPATVTVSNPPVGDIGQENLFNNGTDSESDIQLRKRIATAFSQTKTSSYNTIEQVAFDTGLINSVTVFDIDTKKNLAENEVETFVSTESGSRLSPTSLDYIHSEIKTVKPVGSIHSLTQAMNTRITFDLTVYVSSETLADTTALETSINEIITVFIGTKEIGEDILPSSIISLLTNLSDVLDIEINNYTVSEFSSETATLNDTIILASAGTETVRVAVQVPFNSATNYVYDTDTVLSGSYNLIASDDPYPVDTRSVSPRVNIGIIGHDGDIRPSSLDRTNYVSGSSRSVISYDAATVGGTGIVGTDTVLFNYNYFDNSKIDGFRIILGGDEDNVVRLDFGYGDSPDEADFTSLLSSNYVDVTLDGTEREYEFDFGVLPGQIDCDDGLTTPVYAPDVETFYIILKHQSGSGESYIPIDATASFVQFSPTLYEDQNGDTNYGFDFETVSSQRMYFHSYTKFSDANAYKKIIIPSQSDEPEKPISHSNTVTFSKYVEE